MGQQESCGIPQREILNQPPREQLLMHHYRPGVLCPVQGTQYKRDKEILEQVQQKARKIKKGLELGWVFNYWVGFNSWIFGLDFLLINFQASEQLLFVFLRCGNISIGKVYFGRKHYNTIRCTTMKYKALSIIGWL